MLETTIVLVLLYGDFAFVGVFVVNLVVGLACCLLELVCLVVVCLVFSADMFVVLRCLLGFWLICLWGGVWVGIAGLCLFAVCACVSVFGM